MKLLDRVWKETDIHLCLITMGIMNFSIVCYVVSIQALTQTRAAKEGAVAFFRTLNTTPMSPVMRVYVSLACYLLIICCIIFKNKLDNKGNISNAYLLYNVIEIITLIILMATMDLAYNGIVFFVMAEFLHQIGSNRHWIPFLVVSFFTYILSNYNIVSLIIPLNSFEVWAHFYNNNISSYILGIKTMCDVLNIMMFLLFVTMMTRQDKAEKLEIRRLYNRLTTVNTELKDANDQLHAYALDREQMGEMKERNRLAREIHDTIGHGLTGISVGLEAVSVLIDISPDMAKQQLSTISQMARTSLDDVRRSVRKLKPDALETKSLELALREMLDETANTTGTKIYFVTYGENINYGIDEEETIYRIVQEGTTNSLRHGKATEMWVRIDRKPEGTEITIKDNGSGSEEIVEGFGLTHMRERVEMLKGTISFSSEEGFEIFAFIPIRKNEQN